MRSHHDPWFRSSLAGRFERECDAIGLPAFPYPDPGPKPLLSDLLEPGKSIFLGLTRTTYPTLRANVGAGGRFTPETFRCG